MSSSQPGETIARLPILTLTALGIVYGDIGTSPLYAVRECFLGTHGPASTPDNILGVLSLIIWSLILVISVKYLGFVLRADNHGEGGILALMSLITRDLSEDSHRRRVVVTLGVFGAALLYGDGMITPAISVLSAIEGLNVATTLFQPYVIPVALGILTALFCVQQRGTAKIGAIFGPIMLCWFAVLSIMGLQQIVRQPGVLLAVDPHHAVRFILANGWRGFAVLGTVFLVVTGGEALYADMGHFGKRPIRYGWFVLVLPALLLNYLGQGALLMQTPTAVDHLFYLMAPGWALYPLVVLATMATVIASQAVISGAFSLTRQAIHLGYCPRMAILHTSAEEIGQIYVPTVNWALFVGTVALVLGFQKSGNLAHAYGIAVTSTMLITTLLTYMVARGQWHWSRGVAWSLTAAFLVLDTAFFGANIVKVVSGGWFPLLVAGFVYFLMTTWRRGRAALIHIVLRRTLPMKRLLDEIERTKPVRVPGTSVYLTINPQGAPMALMYNYRHNRALHEHILLLTMVTLEVPYVPTHDQMQVEALGQGFYRVQLQHGFRQVVDIPAALGRIKTDDFTLEATAVSYFLGRESLLASDDPSLHMWPWQKRLFVFMARNARNAGTFFGIPPHQAVEIGAHIQI